MCEQSGRLRSALPGVFCSFCERDIHDLEGKGIAGELVRLDASTNKLMMFFLDPDGLTIEIYE